MAQFQDSPLPLQRHHRLGSSPSQEETHHPYKMYTQYVRPRPSAHDRPVIMSRASAEDAGKAAISTFALVNRPRATRAMITKVRTGCITCMLMARSELLLWSDTANQCRQVSKNDRPGVPEDRGADCWASEGATSSATRKNLAAGDASSGRATVTAMRR